MRTNRLLISGVLLAAFLFIAGCKKEKPVEPGIRSYLSGQITLDPRIDSTGNSEGIEVVVYHRDRDGAMLTLGRALTARNGSFSMEVRAPERGVYPIVISRRDSVFKVDDLAVSDGDTATVRASVPSGKRPLIIRSRENGAWLAFKNTRELHNQTLSELTQKEGTTDEQLARSVLQTVNIMWTMKESYPNTVGADLAGAQSIVMLAGIDDPLLIQRARELSPENPGYVEASKAARRAMARLQGPAAGINLLRDFIEKSKDFEDRAALNGELVSAYMDNNRPDQARQAARELVRDYPGTQWAAWGERAVYDFEHLEPGMRAPDFDLQTIDGRRVTLESFRGGLLLLEFYRPDDQVFQNELSARNAMVNALRGAPFNVLTVSVDPDTTINKAFFQTREFPGAHVVLGPVPAGVTTPADVYNVFFVPRRILIDGEGRIISKYDGASISILQQEIAALFTGRR